MDGCSLAEGGAGGKEGAGSFWDMTFSASLIRSSCFAKVRSALLSKPDISFSKYSPMTWVGVGGLLPGLLPSSEVKAAGESLGGC